MPLSKDKPTDLDLGISLASVTITPPDEDELKRQYQVAISPAVGFCVVDNNTYIEAGRRFNAAAMFMDFITDAFKGPKALAYQTHKSITALEASFLAPAKLTKDSLALQQLAWRRKLEDARIAEEQRLQREAQAIAEADHAKQQAILDAEIAEVQRLLEESFDDTPPWEEQEPVPLIERVILPTPEVAPVRLPSTVPMVAGGPGVRKSPWIARVDLKALVSAAAKDETLLQYLEAKMPLLNAAAREHGTCIGDIIPGVTAYREERLARG